MGDPRAKKMVAIPVDLIEQAVSRWPELLEHPEVRALAPRQTAEGAVRAVLFLTLRYPGPVGGYLTKDGTGRGR